MGLIGGLTASGASADALPPIQEEITRGLEAQFQVSLIRERKLADDRESGLIQLAETRLLKAHTEVAKEEGDTHAAQAELSAARAAYAQLAASVASRDAEARAEIEAYHEQVADLTKTADPALAAALQDYADGDRVGAYPAIKRLLLAENAAADAGVAERDAERLRDLASYAMEMAERGEGPVSEAIADWEAAQQKSPTEAGWSVLVSLDIETGQMADAKAAAQALLEGARQPTDKPAALIQIAVIDARQADLTGATQTMLQAEALVKPLAQTGGPDSLAAALLDTALSNLILFANVSDDAKDAAAYSLEREKLHMPAKGVSAVGPAANDPIAKLQADLDALDGRGDWAAAEPVANQLIDAVKHSDAYVKGDDVDKATLLAPPVETLKDILGEEIYGAGGAAKVQALHEVLVERVALQDTLHQRNRIVGDDYNFRSEDILDLAELDAEMGELGEAKQQADKAVALQDARGTESSQDYYEVLILVRALQDSAESSLSTGLRDNAAAAFAAAIPPAERAVKVMQTFEAVHGRPLAAEKAEALSLLTLAGAHMYSGDLAGALAPMTSANAIYERLSPAHVDDDGLSYDLWTSRFGMAKVTNDPARWRQLATFIAGLKPDKMNSQLAAWLADARSHLAAAH